MNKKGLQNMTSIKTGAIVLALAAAFAAVATPSFAQQMTRYERMSAEREARAEAQYGSSYRSNYRVNGQFQPGNMSGYWTNWNECKIDNGYGRFDTCHH
jgi:Tfp pilus assembly protein FimT